MIFEKKFGIFLFTLSLVIICASSAIIHNELPEDTYLNFTELGAKYGHPVKQHEVTTDDGYILTLFNLPGSGPPVLLVHGIIDSADTFIIRGNISLAITLANTNYDVWVGNTRGNKYALKHKTLESKGDKKFWDFSFHEGGIYDLPAMIDFVLNATGKENLTTIGHSQGTTEHFVLGSERPEYNRKINLFIALAPVVYLDNVEPPVSTVIKLAPALNVFFKSKGMEQLMEDHTASKMLIELVCSLKIIGYKLCAQLVMFNFAGSDPESLEPEFLPVVMKHYPSSTSRKSAMHFAQVSLRNAFAQYDYGVENLVRYGNNSPPSYDLSKVTMKVALIASKNDAISKIEDVNNLDSQLSNVVKYHIMELDKWNHIDYVWGRYTPQYLYPQITELLEKYN